MKNRTIFSSVLLVVLVSALFFSVSTVFGAQLPSENPPAGLTAPMFSGLDLQGAVKNTVGDVIIDDTLDIRNYIQNTTGDVKIGDTLDVMQGQIKTSLGGSIKIENLEVTKNFTSAGILSSPDANLLELTDETHIVGPLLLHKKIPVIDPNAGEISAVEGQDVIINGTVIISGNNLGDKSELKSDVVTGLEIGSRTTFTNITDVAASGAATLKLGTGTQWMGLDTNEISSYGGALYLQNDSGQGVYIGSDASPSSLRVYGHLRAEGIGTYANTSSSFITVANNSNGTVTSACAAGYVITGCGFYGWAGITVYAAETSTALNTCTVRANNTSGGPKNIQAIARCFDPGG